MEEEEEEDWRSGSIIKCIDVTFSSDSRFSSVPFGFFRIPLDEEIVFIFQTSRPKREDTFKIKRTESRI